MIELRKDYFADERDDDLHEIGKPTQRQDAVGPRHRPLALLRRPSLRRPPPPSLRAQPASPRSYPVHRRFGGRADARRAQGSSRAGRAAQPQHAAQPPPVRAGRRAAPLRREGRLCRRGRRGRRRRHGGAGARCGRQGAGGLGGAAARARRRGGAEGRRAQRQRGLSVERLHLSRQIRPSETALRRRGSGLRLGRPCRRGALSDVAHRAGSDRDLRGDRGAGDQRSVRVLHLDPGALLLARHGGQAARRLVGAAALHRRHGGRRVSAARSTACTSPWRSSAP